jgi:precorrin-6B methylase 1
LPITLNFSDDGETIEMVGSGDIGHEDILAAVREIYTSPVLAGIKYQLVDYSLVTSYKRVKSAAIEIVNLDRLTALKNPNMKIAIIAPGDLLFASARSWELNLEEAPLETRIFRERGAAETWLFAGR